MLKAMNQVVKLYAYGTDEILVEDEAALEAALKLNEPVAPLQIEKTMTADSMKQPQASPKASESPKPKKVRARSSDAKPAKAPQNKDDATKKF